MHKDPHLTTIFRLPNIHLVFSTCPHKYKFIFCTKNPVLNASFKDLSFKIITNMNNHLICFEKII